MSLMVVSYYFARESIITLKIIKSLGYVLLFNVPKTESCFPNIFLNIEISLKENIFVYSENFKGKQQSRKLFSFQPNLGDQLTKFSLLKLTTRQENKNEKNKNTKK